jgi:uncharacterized membrane protein
MRPNRLTRVLAAVLVPCALLAACGKSEDATTPAPEPPADAPANVTAPAPATDFTRPINALGNEPFWALKIRPEGLTFSEAGKSDRTEANPGPKAAGTRASWTGATVEAVLTAAVCQDGMSDRVYPFTAEVKTGGKTLKGCATYADEAPAP